MNKYDKCRPDCGELCLVGGCKTKELGACYHVCRQEDFKRMREDIKSGRAEEVRDDNGNIIGIIYRANKNDNRSKTDT